MTDSRNIGGHFHSISEPHAGDFPKSRVGLFGSGRRDFHANSALEGAMRRQRPIFERVENLRHRRRFGFSLLDLARSFFELVDCRH